MHEYQLTKNIISTAEEYALSNGGSKVTAINLVVGDYSGCVADCIELYFDIIAEGSMCTDAKLNIERVHPKLKCKVCGEYFDRLPFDFSCTRQGCNGEGVPTEIGREFYVKSISIE